MNPPSLQSTPPVTETWWSDEMPGPEGGFGLTGDELPMLGVLAVTLPIALLATYLVVRWSNRNRDVEG